MVGAAASRKLKNLSIMKNTQHTPGPWIFGPDPLNGEIPGTFIHNHVTFIAKMEPINSNSESSKEVNNGKAEVEANARLIASAPELLECLVRTTYAGTQKELDLWTEKAKEAIKKATETNNLVS